jgi:CRISPR-associated endonuclease/helicase Cas3
VSYFVDTREYGSVQGPPTDFWGKLERSEDGAHVIAWHPLRDHCADVAAVTEALLDIPVWRERFGVLARAKPLDPIAQSRLCVLAALHDLGKLNLGFQAKGRPELGTKAGHVAEAIAALEKDVCLCLQPLNDWGEATYSLLVASLCHHGRPISQATSASSWQSSWWSPRCSLDPAAGLKDLLGRCREWFPAAFVRDSPPMCGAPELGHAFAGLVMLADWLASDVRFFPFSEVAGDDRISFSRQVAHRAVHEMGLERDLESRQDPDGRDTFHRIAPPEHSPRHAQRAVLSLSLQYPAVRILESETGSGKTEAALAHFISLFECGAVDGMYFALPTRTAATQIFNRVRESVARAFVDPPPVVLAVPGYLRVDEAEGQRLPRFEVLWPDSGRFRFRSWAAERPKRFLVGAIVVGTIDQVLLSSLRVGHAHLRATSLLRHLLVVDEVHASDAYMTRILEDVLGRHLQAGGHALLLSATLGGETRARLLDPGGRIRLPSFEDAVTAAYPLISTQHASTHVPQEEKDRTVQIEAAPLLEDVEAVAARALAVARTGAKVLVLRNTVQDCILTQEAVERQCDQSGILFRCHGVAAPHHARFARVDRVALDEAIERYLGKERAAEGGIVVATQTVQQSLDLDADHLVTDLCPIDVLLQRIGRLHRHKREKRPGDDQARAMILVPLERDLSLLIGGDGRARNHHGLGSVYEDLRILEATWRTIERHSVWRIPSMSRSLIESCLHSTALVGIVSSGGPSWQLHEMQMIGQDAGMRRQAELNLVDWSIDYGDSRNCFPDTPEERIFTRLGEGDRRVLFEPVFVGPFGSAVRELSVRASWARGAGAEENVAREVNSRCGATRFAYGDRWFVYDRLGLRPDGGPSPQKDVHDDDGP